MFVGGVSAGCAIFAAAVRALRTRGHGARLTGVLIALAALLGLSGCTLLENTLSDRETAVNVGSASTREDGILLNIVRASRSEPLNFMTLSKYNAAGTLEGSIGMTHNGDALNYNIINNSPITTATSALAKTASNAFVRNAFTPSVRSNTAMNFDVAPLENQEFYTQFMSPLGLDRLNLLVNAGIPRELVLHSIVKSARMVHRDGREFDYNNDPTDDRWDGENGPDARAHCEGLQSENAFHRPFTHSAWDKPHINDCNYQKFLYFLRNALQYGMTTEVVDTPPKALSETAQTKTQTLTVVLTQAPQASKQKVRLCFDRAIAASYDKTVHGSIACNSKAYGASGANYQDLGPNVRLINPELRSPYAIFQYYGKMLSSKTVNRVRLFDRPPMLQTGDKKILTVKNERGDCFASAYHRGESYCVPNQGATNTKEIFTLLNVLVNLSLKASSLPTTPSIQVAPGG